MTKGVLGDDEREEGTGSDSEHSLVRHCPSLGGRGQRERGAGLEGKE